MFKNSEQAQEVGVSWYDDVIMLSLPYLVYVWYYLHLFHHNIKEKL